MAVNVRSGDLDQLFLMPPSVWQAITPVSVRSYAVLPSSNSGYGVIISERTSHGAYAIATCEGQIP